MLPSRLKWLLDWRTFSALSLVGLLVCGQWQGWTGSAGFALGVIGTGGNLLGLWLVIRLLAKTAENRPNTFWGTLLVSVSFLLALPLVLACMAMSHHLGPASDRCFLAGLTLVYSRLIGQGLFVG